MVAVVSLLRKGDVELRLFKPAPLPPPRVPTDPESMVPADQRPGYGLFYLKRRDEGCGF
jgi:hypothetical protein